MNQSVVSSFLGQQFFWIPVSMSYSFLCVYASMIFQIWLVDKSWYCRSARLRFGPEHPSATHGCCLLVCWGVVSIFHLLIVSLLSSWLERFCLLLSVIEFQMVSGLFSENIQTNSRPKVNKGIFSLNFIWYSFSFSPSKWFSPLLFCHHVCIFMGFLLLVFRMKVNFLELKFFRCKLLSGYISLHSILPLLSPFLL